MNESQKPTVTQLNPPFDGERHSHPAFGMISVAKGVPSHGGAVLFGSDLKHRSVITVTLSTAVLDRRLSRDWHQSDNDLVRFHMSEAQWATFVSSTGGAGVPITYGLRPVDGAQLQHVPRIEKVESVADTFDREVREKCEAYMATATELVDRLKECASSGKVNKGTLNELARLASTLSVGLPNTMEFVQKQMREVMERNVNAGKIELEAHVNDLAMRRGFEALREEAPKLSGLDNSKPYAGGSGGADRDNQDD